MNGAGSNAIEVFVFQAGRFLGSRCFTQHTVVIGSGGEAALRLRDPSIAERHAVLRVERGSLVLASNTSSGHVLVNGEPVSVRQVHSFDEVRIGPFRLKVSLLANDDNAGFGVPDPAHTQAPTHTPVIEQQRTEIGSSTGTPGYYDNNAVTVEPAGYPPVHGASDETTRVSGAPSWFDEAPADTHLAKGQPADFDNAPTRMARRPSPEQPHARDLADELFDSDGVKDPTVDTDALDPSAFDGTAPLSTLDQQTPATQQPYTPRTSHTPPSHTPQKGGGRGGYADIEGGAPLSSVEAPEFQDTMRPDGMAQPPGDFGDAGYAAPAPVVNDGPDDDDDDDEDFVESFSLLENIVRERFKTPAETAPYAVVEVIRYRNGEIADLQNATVGQSYKTYPDGFRLLKVSGEGRAQLFFKSDFSGSIVRGGKSRPLSRLARPETLVSSRKQIHAIELQEGDFAQVVHEKVGYLARFVRPPVVPKAPFKMRFNMALLQVIAGSAAFHFLILALLGFVAPQADLYVEPEAEQFAKVAAKDLKLEKPPEEPKKEEPPPPEPPPEAPDPKPTKRAKADAPPRRGPLTPKQKAKVQKKQVGSVLSALKNIAPAGAPGRSNLKSLVTNIKAVRTPSGVGSGFKVSGVIGKIAGKGVRLAGGGRGGSDTKVGSRLLAGTSVGNIKAIAGTGRRVRGRARKAPTRSIKATGGFLSREAIQKVVARHMAKIQACYERQLLVNRGLAGKIVFDWVIASSGSVSSARQVSSSVPSVAVSTCILSEIRRWRFPQPVGGSVQVRYPFVFRVQGF